MHPCNSIWRLSKLPVGLELDFISVTKCHVEYWIFVCVCVVGWEEVHSYVLYSLCKMTYIPVQGTPQVCVSGWVQSCVCECVGVLFCLLPQMHNCVLVAVPPASFLRNVFGLYVFLFSSVPSLSIQLSNKARGGVVYGQQPRLRAVLMHDTTLSVWTQPLAVVYWPYTTNPRCALLLL